MISRSFLKSSVVFTIGGAMPMLASIILLPFYTNILAPVHLTQVIFYISVSLLFQILFSYSVESYFGIQYTRLGEDPGKQKRFIGTVALLLLLIGGALILLSAACGNYVFSLIFNDKLDIEFWPYGFYSILTAFFNSFFKAATVGLIYFKKARLFLVVNGINFIATLAISIGGLYLFPGTIIGPMYGRLISGVIIFLIAYQIFKNHGTIIFDKTFLSELVSFCTPYLFFVLSLWVLGQADRYILQKYIPINDLNAYDVLLKCFFGIEFLQNSLTAVIYPKLFEIWSKNSNNQTTTESNRYFNVFTAINIIQLIVFCICIPFLYRLVISNETLYVSERYIGLLAAGFALRSIQNFYLATILFTKKILLLLRIFGISAIFQLLITYLMVMRWGLMGAIYAGLLTRILQVVLCIIFTRGIFIYSFNFFKIILVPFIYIAVNVIQFIVFDQYSLILYAAQLLVFSGIFYLVFRNEIRKVLVSFKILPTVK